MTIAKPPPSSSNKKEGVEESIILQQALYCIEDNYDVMTASPTTLQLITAICTNIVTHPNEEKFRKIKIANPKFNEFVMGVEGAINLLMLCGFEVDDSGEYIVLKKENFVSRDLQDLIAAIDIKTKNNSTTTIVQKSTPTSSASSSSSSVVKPTTGSSSVYDAEMEERKKKMLEEKKKIQAEKEKIKQQLLADKEERKHLPTGVCSRKTAKPNTTSKKSFRDIGVDLNKGGG